MVVSCWSYSELLHDLLLQLQVISPIENTIWVGGRRIGHIERSCMISILPLHPIYGELNDRRRA